MKHNPLDPSHIEEYCHQVLQQKPMPGCDNKTVQDYHEQESKLAHELCQSLLDHSYEPTPYLRFWLIQNQKKRPIDIPSIRDRVLMRMVLDQLRQHPHNKIPQPLYGVAQKGWQQAIHKIETLLQQNDTLYALKVDIKDYYPSIPHHLLKQRIAPYLSDPFLNLVLQWVNMPSIDHDRIIFNQTHGVPQGIPIANALANIYLYELDQWISSHNVYYFRYLDDLLMIADRKKILSKIKRKLPG